MHDQCTLDDVRQALGFVHDADVRDTWIEVGMAIKAEFGDAGFDVWDAWSQQADNYNAGAARSSWKSFKRSAGGIGIGTLFAKAKSGGYTFERRELTLEEKKAWAKEKAAREHQRKIDAEREAAEEAAWFERVAVLSQSIWDGLKPMGRSPYLGRKKVKSYGLRFFAGPLLLVAREDHVEHISDWSRIKPILDTPKEQRERQGIKIQLFRKGCCALPLMDMQGRIWNLQVIYESGEKRFLRNGRKHGLLYWIGEPDPAKPLILVEGYSTGASIREATSVGEEFGCPVVMCFDCGNLMEVAVQLRELYPDQHMVFAADDDAHQKVNDGVEKAKAAARAVGGSVWLPSLNEELEEAA